MRLVCRAKPLLATAILAVVFSPVMAQASDCELFGTGPFCKGSCPSGWKLLHMRGSNCVTGSKALCCKVATPCTRYGTPGCPYPSLGKRLKLPVAVKSCPGGMFKARDGQCYPLLH